MTSAELALEIVQVGMGAATKGVAAAIAGKSAEEALMEMVEHIQNERAKEKFAGFKEG